jgi:hypothetical protein
VVVSRVGGEAGAYYPGEEGLADGVHTVNGNILSLSDEEMAMIEEAKANYTKVKEAEVQIRIKAAQNGTYIPKESERGIFHVKLDKPAFDPKSGAKLSKEYIQKFTQAEWNQFLKNSSGLGYTMEIMWNPEVYNL